MRILYRQALPPTLPRFAKPGGGKKKIFFTPPAAAVGRASGPNFNTLSRPAPRNPRRQGSRKPRNANPAGRTTQPKYFSFAPGRKTGPGVLQTHDRRGRTEATKPPTQAASHCHDQNTYTQQKKKSKFSGQLPREPGTRAPRQSPREQSCDAPRIPNPIPNARGHPETGLRASKKKNPNPVASTRGYPKSEPAGK